MSTNTSQGMFQSILNNVTFGTSNVNDYGNNQLDNYNLSYQQSIGQGLNYQVDQSAIGYLREVFDIMNWKCTNPSCGKDLTFAKRHQHYKNQAGMVVLECTSCGFEFMAKALTEEDRISSKAKINIAELKNQVKHFNLK